jgi:hypothetical protein
VASEARTLWLSLSISGGSGGINLQELVTKCEPVTVVESQRNARNTSGANGNTNLGKHVTKCEPVTVVESQRNAQNINGRIGIILYVVQC